MKQSRLDQRYCSYHTQEQMILACLDKDCIDGKKCRIICTECLAKGDHSHINNRVNMKLLNETIQKNNFDTSELIKRINYYIESFQGSLDQLKKQVINTLEISYQHLNFLSNREFNDYLSSIINFHDLEKEINGTLAKCWNDFANTIKQLSTVHNSRILIKKVIDEQIDKFYKQDIYYFIFLGQLYFDDKNYENALEHFDQVLFINPNHIQSLAYKGRALYYQRKFEESIPWFERALGLDSSNVTALHGKGNALRLLNKEKESIEWFDKALKIDEKCKYALHGKGDALRIQGYFNESLEFFNKALEVDPNYFMALSSKGATLLGAGNYFEAEIWLMKALMEDPNSEFVKNKLNELHKYTKR